jgi:predicted oxidoreductase
MTEPTSPRLLGRSGIVLSDMGWGMWRLAGAVAPARALCEAAIEAGFTLFDTADIYGFGAEGFGAAEALLGRVFAEDPSLRARVVLATKGGITPPVPYDSSPAYLSAALDASLKRLQVDQVDLYQIHRPDILAHPQEAARTLENAVAAGKVREVGVSNFTVAQIEALQHFLPFPLASTQPELSPVFIAPIDDGQMDQAMRLDLAVLAWSPLGGGRLATGQGRDGREAAVIAALDAVAAAHGVDRGAAALAWVMAHPARPIPLIGSQDPARIKAAAAARQVRLTRTQWYAVFAAARGTPLP